MSSAPPLAIRNLTSTPLELKLIERYEAPGTETHHHFSRITRNITTLVNNTSPAVPQLDENAPPSSTEDVSIRLEPFQISKPEVQAAQMSGKEILRLTFENEGERHRITTPSPQTQSQALQPLAPNPRFQYTGIFIPKDSFLTLYSSANLQCWMQELKDETPLSGISIPGTHNSPTYHKALPSVRCQAVPPRVQLENGVRFFDIRVQPESPEDPSKDGLVLVHGVFPISLTGNKYFRDLVNVVRTFLDENPSETVIMSVKREGPGNATDQQLSCILRDHYAGDVGKWFTAPRIPTLGEVRGKITLMRRFALDDRIRQEWDGAGWCIDAENWAYNTPNDTHGDVCVQDFCEVLETPSIEQKITFCEEHFERAGCLTCPLPGITTDAEHPVPPSPFYLNFLSASNFWKVGCWPEKIAARLNPAVTEFLCEKHHENGEGDGCLGIVVCDWVGKDGDWDLVRCIVGMNAKLEMREREMR
ncbi:hypothetical protein B0A49_00752 [Cryomyces minteri]|uniref:Phosphatidylinositol-specific phospholipase C X domain-containing protein n=1 Tax=Cryomyces minteri TaxID=331657 RepID=A0A4U0XUG8_9PEZI|nr:hypothetical protein B0A49_00752 [Cryomyces minteri]